ncbi:MAG: HlyD family efflux transporter periplasmic adaptor subunit [Planctomycetota bacterium]|nr:MAG: HlyD family efflux transporter periplasmic adaptor subunit [Planctomycetota bacterium]
MTSPPASSRRVAAVLALLALAAAAAGVVSLRGDPAPPTQLRLYGNVDIREARLAFNGSEHVSELLVDEGDRVEKGQVLARLHTERLKLLVREAEAQVAAQSAIVSRMEAGSRPEEIARARAERARAEAEAKGYELTFARLKRLRSSDVTSQEQVDEAEAAAKAARARVAVAEQTLALLEAGPRAEDIAAARAELALRQATLAYRRELLADATLRAPWAGVVRERILEPGDMASPQTPVFTLARIDPVWVRAFVPERALGRVAVGLPVEIRTDSYPDKVYRGRVGFVSPTAEFTPKNVETPELRTRLVYQIRIDVQNPRNELRLGMPVTVLIPLGSDRSPESSQGEPGSKRD